MTRTPLVWPALLGILVLLSVAAPAYAETGNPFLPLLFKQVSDWTPRATVTPGTSHTPTATPTGIATATPTATVDVGPAVLRITPADQVVLLAGGTFSVSVDIENVSDLGAFGFGLAYDPSVVEAMDVSMGPFLGSTGNVAIPFGPAIGQGWVNFSALGEGMAPGPNGAGSLAIVTFEPVGEGSSALHLQNLTLQNKQSQSLPIDAVDGVVTVTAGGIATD